MFSAPPFSDLPTAAESRPADGCLVCWAYGERYGEIVRLDSPTACSSCGAPTWDGLHRNGYRDCVMAEVPGV